ncbi:MAG: DUF134 domain-containing protein [Candidatus Omnitrophica bacterium]|nr:DUF134 domain-containing protein [Candidatus Omnitrophota bacterium]
MGRPRTPRHIESAPRCETFVPAGVPRTRLNVVTMTLDEFEALKLADVEGLYQEEAALRMNVSRPTFTRITRSARAKVARALWRGSAIRMRGGSVIMMKKSPPKRRTSRLTMLERFS